MLYVLAEPTPLDSALRTTPDTPTIGTHPPTNHVTRLRIADNQTGTHHWCPPMKPQGESTRRAATCQRGATEVTGPARTATMTSPVRRKSSTGRRAHPPAPTDSTSTTRPTTHPQQPETGPHSALRTTPATPIIGAHPQIFPSGTPTNRQSTWANNDRKWLDRQRLRKPPPRTSAMRTTPAPPIIGAHPPITGAGAILRLADNHGRTHDWCAPTNCR